MAISTNQLVTSGNVLEVLPEWARGNKPTFYLNQALCNGSAGGVTPSVVFTTSVVYLNSRDFMVLLTSSSNQTVTLPSSSSAYYGQTFFIIKVSSGALLINGNGSNCYYGGTNKGSETWALSSYNCLAVCTYNGTNWYLYAMPPA